jgi:CheY-like chemotaxis protein
MPPPLVLAIEPDLRQAAIVKRIVREKVQADVAVVDSRDAALEAMRTSVPDVLLLSALLSPRDENELIAHLRTLEHVQHLQTHTIPQLASSIGPEDEKRSRGLLSAFRRRKGSGAAPTGCDPDLFAEEIRTYLQRASDKKRELRDTAARQPAGGVIPRASAAAPAARQEAVDDTAAAPPSSWSSPFEWRPSRSTTATPPASQPEPASKRAPRPTREAEPLPAGQIDPPPFASPTPASDAAPESIAVPESIAGAGANAEPIALPDATPVPETSVEPAVVAPAEPVAALAAEPAVVDYPEPVVVPDPEPVAAAAPDVVVIERAPRAKRPLVKRYPHEWWFEDEEPRKSGSTSSEMREVLESLSVPLHVAVIGYSGGCRIRRVRLTAT